MFKLLKFVAVGVFALILGIWQMSSGERQGIVGGAGSLAVAGVIFGVIGWALLRKEDSTRVDGAQLTRAENPNRLLWLGIGMLLLPGLMYLYLSCAMDKRFMEGIDFGSFLAMNVPFLGSGVIVLGLYLWSLRRKKVSPKTSEGVERRGG